MAKSVQIKVTGLVQGVGFRPFIFRLANRFDLFGNVENTNEGVIIHIEGSESSIHPFIHAIRKEAPIASHIVDITTREVEEFGYTRFEIIKSHSVSDAVTEVSPDIAVCDECLADMGTQPNRKNYPFINCTLCGPRFSIIKELPYDRELTSMDVFQMCDACKKEYEDVSDRRFHAQPVACLDCGPEYLLCTSNEEIRGIEAILDRVRSMIQAGEIIAIKGVGGFHFACDATNEHAVSRLRMVKNREGKPFAVLFPDLQTLGDVAFIDAAEEISLSSWRRPVVLLKMRTSTSIAPSVTCGLPTIGAMLPYTPFHHLIYREVGFPPIVLTSGNISDEPIITGNEEAMEKLSGLVDGVLHYNRSIENRTDDSVVKIIGGKERLFRRSRGYAPSPVHLSLDVEGIMAVGVELVNCFCIGKGKMALLSQHIGDLKNVETSDFYRETMEKYMRLFRVDPVLVVSDMHPAYFSTNFATSVAHGVPVIQVQHHHAHIASCMAEHRLDEKVIGVAMDGTGYGDDGKIWGAEFFVCDLIDYERAAHFQYIPLPGGDRAVEEPWRMGVSYLYSAFGDAFMELDIPFVKKTNHLQQLPILLQMIRSNINSPMVSSAGRLFDAVAAILGLCEVATFQAEGPMRLESVIQTGVTDEYSFGSGEELSFLPAICEMIVDVRNQVDAGTISAKFHNCVISAIFDMVTRMSKETGLQKVVLSGGTFQNKYLLENLEKRLEMNGLDVYSHCAVPTNDGGLALGQLAIAAKRRIEKCV